MRPSYSKLQQIKVYIRVCIWTCGMQSRILHNDRWEEELSVVRKLE